MEKIIKELPVPNVIIRHIMIDYLDLDTITILVRTLECANVLDIFSKNLLVNAKKGFSWCCQNGKLDAAKWLRHSSSTTKIKLRDDIFVKVCICGQIDVAKWLHSIGADIYERKKYFGKNFEFNAFEMACINGHLELAKWLYSISIDHFSHSNRNSDFLTFVCRAGHLEIIKWLYSVGADLYTDKKTIFEWTCIDGQMDVAKWLCDIGAYKNSFFCLNLSCLSGHFEITKWLYSFYDTNTNLNINRPNEKRDMFITGCQSGNLELVKWLYDHGDINTKTIKIAFVCCCGEGHLDVCKWLYSLAGPNNPNLFGFFDVDKFKYKRKNSQVRKWLGSIGLLDMEKK